MKAPRCTPLEWQSLKVFFFSIFEMSACASAGRCWLCRWGFFSPVAHRCHCRCSCADGVGRVSLKCLSSERNDVVLKGAWPSRRARALAAALTLFFKVTSEGGAFRRMCGRLIKCCSLPRLMGQIAHYAGLYIMSNCLLLSLPANEPPSYIWMWFCEGKLRFELPLWQEGSGCVQLRLQLRFCSSV